MKNQSNIPIGLGYKSECISIPLILSDMEQDLMLKLGIFATPCTMIIPVERSGSRFVSFVAVFTAMIAVLDSIPILPAFYSGVWGSWMFLLSPLVGILLGPYVGAVSVGLGNLVGHMIYFRDITEFLFMLGAPLGAAMAGFVYQRKWKPVIGLYSVLLLGYFLIDPIAWQLPLWGIWDILVGYGFVLIFVLLVTRNFWPKSQERSSSLGLLLGSVIGLEADILLRVFILVPGQTYWFLLGWTVEVLQTIWLGAGFITPLKVAMSAIVTITLGRSIIRALTTESIDIGTDSA